MSQVLYRKWRPKTFSEVCGQRHITDVLAYEVEHSKTAHAYLFCGSRGTGKTSCAKLLSKAVNCLDSKNGEPCGKCAICLGIDDGSVTDVVEMDAASNNGVDDIRRIRDEVVYSPAMAKYRVYIIDEVHMLSPSAFNALLKTLEEPPENVIFILATTELQKLPATIISRCRRFDFRRISTRTIADRLLHISSAEGIEIEEDAALLLARLAQGGMRDAVSMLELCASAGAKVDTNKVRESAGVSGRESCVKIAEAALYGRANVIFTEIERLHTSSKDIAAFWQELVSFYRDMLVVTRLKRDEAIAYLDLTAEEYNETVETAKKFTFDLLYHHCTVLDDAFIAMQRNVVSKRLCAEFALLRLAEGHDITPDALASRISKLESAVKRMENGGFVMQSALTQPVEEELPQAAEKNAPIPEKEEPTSASDEKKPDVLRTIPYWIEIVRKAENEDSMIGSLLSKSTAYRSQSTGNITIVVSSSFAASMLDKKETHQLIANLVSEYESAGQIIFKSGAKPENVESDALDGIDFDV